MLKNKKSVFKKFRKIIEKIVSHFLYNFTLNFPRHAHLEKSHFTLLQTIGGSKSLALLVPSRGQATIKETNHTTHSMKESKKTTVNRSENNRYSLLCKQSNRQSCC